MNSDSHVRGFLLPRDFQLAGAGLWRKSVYKILFTGYFFYEAVFFNLATDEILLGTFNKLPVLRPQAQVI